MAIALDAAAAGTQADSGSGSRAFNSGSAITVGSGSDRILIVVVNNPAATVSGLRLNTGAGASFTHVPGITRQNAGGSGTVDMWYLLAPATGTHRIYVESTYSYGTVICSAWTGVDQTTPFGTAAQAAGLTVTVSSATGEVVVDGTGTFFSESVTKDATFTLLGQINDASANCGSSYKAGAASVTSTWTGGGDTVICAVPMKPAAGGGGATSWGAQLSQSLNRIVQA